MAISPFLGGTAEARALPRGAIRTASTARRRSSMDLRQTLKARRKPKGGGGGRQQESGPVTVTVTLSGGDKLRSKAGEFAQDRQPAQASATAQPGRNADERSVLAEYRCRFPTPLFYAVAPRYSNDAAGCTFCCLINANLTPCTLCCRFSQAQSKP